jgi:hypothetical protein
MDLESHYKKVKEESKDLVLKERELKTRLAEIKKLKALNKSRRQSIAKLEAELAKELEDLL